MISGATPGAATPRLGTALLVAAAWVALLWWVKLLDDALGWRLDALGVRPHELAGLVGVLTAPLIHGSIEHLVANTGAALILGTLLWYGYPRSRLWAFALIWIGSGLGVWLTGRPSSHIGASGVTHGLMFFLFVAGMLRRDRRSAAFAMIAFFLYGGMVWGVFPTEEDISFESHFWGAVWGVTCALMFRRLDPRPAEKRYAWEEGAEHDDPVIGDQWRSPPPIPPEHSIEPVDLDMYDDADGYNDYDFPADELPPDAEEPAQRRRRWRARRPR
jgi:membrane associated rhomboid family serine protease